MTATATRPPPVVQVVGHRPADIERRWWESALVFLVFAAAYTVVGRWLVVDMQVVGFETLDRFNRAVMVWHNEPPKLSAAGFDHPPLTVLLLAPFTVVEGLARSFVVIPLVTATFAAATMVVLNTMMRRATIALPVRGALLVALGLNPLVVLYAANGDRHFIWIAFVMAALGALFAWYVTADVRFVLVAGMAFALAALSDFGSLVWFVVGAIAVAMILARLGAGRTEVQGTTVGLATPTFYAVAIWTALNLVLVLRPLDWVTSSNDLPAASDVLDLSLSDLLTQTGRLVLYGAPLALVVLPALLFVGLTRRNLFALALAAILLVPILMPGATALLGLTDAPMLMRNALPILLAAVVGAVWLARSAGPRSTLTACLTVAALLGSIPWTFQAMKTYEHQNLESNFAAAVSTGASQEGALTLGGDRVGYSSEEETARWVRDKVSAEGSILTDDAHTYAVMLRTGGPHLFFDRVDRSDDAWQEAAEDPAAHVDYLLLATYTSEDRLGRLYPGAVAGTDPRLPVVHRTPRYVVVEVPDGFRREEVGP